MTNTVSKDTAKATRSSFDLPRTIRRTELRAIVPLVDSTICEMERSGTFPRRFAHSPRCVVWDLAEVQAWLEERRRMHYAGEAIRAAGPDVRLRKSRPVRR